jgi:hypothetical protein
MKRHVFAPVDRPEPLIVAQLKEFFGRSSGG